MNLAPDYEELDNALRSAGLELTAAEMHGIVTAAASFAQSPSLAGLLFDRRRVPDTAAADQLVALGEALQDDVRRRLEDTDFAFEPMLDRGA